ncbi:fumarate/nitrate reduction transcriptional regulator Fnr [Herbaspirillum sp. RTI4]|uniref:fumarate/nitrate reduction transcriptional regulator Fnr n=1 Tax=Herbaspirillum sp. RTI4 TaxID=3048640 RepID=UPI002AB5CB86|nr:fumarate/nitrate reduction transcriptional regulator Fnr [Herbaspirillum sp. RTI4]MDY7578659.1 fumarate/nitrate reduction transcriptional regulator Fnr [Herbaspirillum sp. RTI4]MEA9980643.1 fumarate/nitrate reduction transcriptional regulator Fnr [Herbaspirillum sp. RTI4]
MSIPIGQPLLHITQLSLKKQVQKVNCSDCRMRQLCMPMNLGEEEIKRFYEIISRRRIRRGDYLYRMDDPFNNLYAIHCGYFKTYQTDFSGRQQINGFQMAGALLGMDAIHTGRHQCHSMALEDGEICIIPFFRLETLFREIPRLLHHFHKMMSEEITREQNIMLLLGSMRAEQRLASFLINLSSNYAVRGYSSTCFQLRMSRADIGNYIGLSLETVCRLLTRFKKQGWLMVNQREVKLLDIEKLTMLASCGGEGSLKASKAEIVNQKNIKIKVG